MLRVLFLFLCATMLSAQSFASDSGFTKQTSEPVLVFDMWEDGSQFYRIPALVVAADGSLVAFADKRGDRMNDLPNIISIVAKRSVDGGQTWSAPVTVAAGDSLSGKTYGDVAVALHHPTGNLVAVYSGDQGFWGSNKEKRAGFYVSTSSDNGLTWTAPRRITDQIYQESWFGAFCASGRMLCTPDGRLLFVANTRLLARHELKDVYEFVCCSDDGGETWKVLNPESRIPADGIGNESKLVQLPGGDLIMSIRTPGQRRFSRSVDGGYTWSSDYKIPELVEPDCNGDIISVSGAGGKELLLHSLPADGKVRRDVSVYASADDGVTWCLERQLYRGLSAYTSMAQLPDGSIGCLVEVGKWDANLPGDDGFRIYFTRFELPKP